MADLTPDDFTGTDQARLAAALAALETGGGGRLRLERMYEVTAPLVYSGAPLTVEGFGQGVTGLLPAGLPAWSYALNLLFTDFRHPCLLRDFSILTTDQSANSAIYVQYDVTDACYNRGQHRFAMRDIDIRGRTVNGVGWGQDGFVKGVTLKNVHRPVIERVNQAGKQTGWSESQNISLVMAWELIAEGEFAAPTDPTFRDCQVYSCDTALYATGHWEGIDISGMKVLQAKTAVDVNCGAVAYPYLSIHGSHFNCYRDAVKTVNVFDVMATNNEIFKWDFVDTTGLVPSAGFRMTGAHRSRIANNVFNNLTKDYGTKVQFDAVALTNSNDCEVAHNAMAGVTYGLTVNGGTRNRYSRGSWTDVPTFGPAPQETRFLSAGNIVSY